METSEFIKLCIRSHNSDDPIVMILDGVPLSLVVKGGPHLRIPPECMTDELMQINDQGSSVIGDARPGEVQLGASVQLHYADSKREIMNENHYVTIQTSKISLATLGRFGKQSTMLIKEEPV
tara:strand:+ start:993 stop:1358 length:366 start_codon:yes stop_codon:yes gene_type:complete